MTSRPKNSPWSEVNLGRKTTTRGSKARANSYSSKLFTYGAVQRPFVEGSLYTIRLNGGLQSWPTLVRWATVVCFNKDPPIHIDTAGGQLKRVAEQLPRTDDASSYCWWFRNPANSPVEGTVVEMPLFTTGFSTIPGGCLGFLPINSMTHTLNESKSTSFGKKSIESLKKNQPNCV